jgi:RNA polymerase sigma-70 factor (ECF subfamily)
MQNGSPEPADHVRELLELGEVDAAISYAIEGYGPEILGFLVAVTRDADTADDIFSIFCEDVWKGLVGFRWEGALRAWLYTLCRRALVRYRRSAYQKNRCGLSALGTLSQVAAKVRTAAHESCQAASPTQFSRLRDQLTEDERALLILRVDRGLAWNEIAQSMDDGDAPLTDTELHRQAAALRKRFERIKDRLRVLAREAGLLSDP